MKKELTLNSHFTIPIIGLGTWQLGGTVAYHAVKMALGAGYTHFDTADAYDNHTPIGEALRDSKIPRDKLFITSKIWRDEFKKGDVKVTCQRALRELGMDYLDLYLLHWPNKDVPIKETLEAMKKIQEEGLVKSIGVSNFTVHHLKDVLETGITVSVNQVEFHPSFIQSELKKFCDEHGIILTAYSQFAQGKDLKIPAIQEMAKRLGKSEAQIILNWLIQKDISVIPRASIEEHIVSNIKALEFDLEPQDCAIIDALNTNTRIITPEFAEFSY